MTAIKIGIQVTKRLADVHRNRIIHCDLKPHNLVIGLGEHTSALHLIDFGVSDYFMNKRIQHVAEKRID